MVFSESKYFFSQRSRILFSRQLVATLFFFLQKQYFLRHKVLTEYFFLPISETENVFQASLKFADKKIFPKKPIFSS